MAFDTPNSVSIWVYMGMKTLEIPLAINAKIVIGIFMDMIYASLTPEAP